MYAFLRHVAAVSQGNKDFSPSSTEGFKFQTTNDRGWIVLQVSNANSKSIIESRIKSCIAAIEVNCNALDI